MLKIKKNFCFYKKLQIFYLTLAYDLLIYNSELGKSWYTTISFQSIPLCFCRARGNRPITSFFYSITISSGILYMEIFSLHHSLSLSGDNTVLCFGFIRAISRSLVLSPRNSTCPDTRTLAISG